MPDRERPLVMVSKSEPHDVALQLCAYGLNAVAGEAGTDYVWYPHSQQWGIERKRIDNLLGSLKDRQLVEQTHRGSEQFDRYIILIEGEYRRKGNGLLEYFMPRDPRADSGGWVESGWQYAAVSGMLFDLQLIGNNITITHWPVLFDAASAIARIVLTTHDDNHKFIRERQRPDLPASAALGGKLYSHALWSLMALPGCGEEVAQAVLREAGTLQAAMSLLANVNASQHISINGKLLGSKRAEKLSQAVLTAF